MRICLALVLIPFLGPLSQGRDETTKVRPRTARQTLDKFLEFVLSGKDEEACALCDPRTAVCRQLKDIRSLLSREKIRLVDAWAGDREAIAFTNSTEDDRGRSGVLLITARKKKEKGAPWQVVDLDFEDPGGLKKEFERFRDRNPKAIRTLSSPTLEDVIEAFSANAGLLTCREIRGVFA